MSDSLQQFLVEQFLRWRPGAAREVGRSTRDVTLCCEQERFSFLCGARALLYQVDRKDKLPPWERVYSGGKSTVKIDNLPPCSPHRFRLRLVVKASAVAELADLALQQYGTESEVRARCCIADQPDDGSDDAQEQELADNSARADRPAWLESRWSALTHTSTESAGTSALCFCMAVRGLYYKQVQMMLEERPALLDMVNASTGYTPLATAVRRGDAGMVKFLLSLGADVHARSACGRTALHLAALGGHAALVILLLERGADLQARDVNGLRAEHCAVDAGCVLTVRALLNRGGDVHAADRHGWTPLFRAVCQGAATELVEELVSRGSDVTCVDAAGLALPAAARLLRHPQGGGGGRASVLRLVDEQFPREAALAHFTRLTKKISNVHSLARV